MIQSLKNKVFIFFFIFTGFILFSQNEINKHNKYDNLNVKEKNIETADSLNGLAEKYLYRNLDSALLFGNKALIISQNLGYIQGIAESHRNIGRAYIISGNYEKSFDLFYKALVINEKMKDTLSIGKNYASIGIIHYFQGDFDKALDFLKKALLIYRTEKYEIGLAKTYNNIGLIYSDLNKQDTALLYFNKTVNLSKKTGELKIEISALGNIARIYMIKNNFYKAIEISLKIPEKAERIKDYSVLSTVYVNIGTAYLNLAKEEKNKKKKTILFDKSLNYNKMALVNAKHLNSNSLRAYAYKGFSDIYKAEKDYENAFINLEKFSAVNDSIFNRQKTEAIANIEAKYETEKKQLIIENLQKEKQKDFIIIKKKNTIILITIIGFLVVFVLLLFLFKLYRAKNQTLKLLDEKNKDILKQREEIAAQRDKLSEIAFELKKSNRTKNKFFSIIAHDLKNPFQGIIGFSELIKKQAKKEDLKGIEKFSEYIFDVSNQTYKLLDNLLNFTRSQIGLIKYSPERFNIKQIVEDGILLSESNANAKGINLINEVGNDIFVYADETMISTVVRNLISNAVKFTNKGGFVKIVSEKKRHEVILKIIDNGIGIKEADIPKLFKADLNFSTFGTQNEKGTGLGLVVCKDFIVKNGGTISVESKLGFGSTFTVSLPENQ